MSEPKANAEELFARLAEAREKYEIAEGEERRASSACLNALNELNAAQRAVDKFMETTRENAPRRSDWQQLKRRG